jgi:site-specific DNA-methyltransferase (adenine-specific)/site-specific DNA-methyltransferase (cytosine-N4-specific)
MELNKIICSDCKDFLLNCEDKIFDLVVTSPPYAQQRFRQYGGIPEEEYPLWTVEWMNICKRLLKPTGSVAIVIRPHIKNGQISDYVLKTRLAVRSAGWIECEELIWIKPDSPPLGAVRRPRRAWESILWFSTNKNPYCDPKANGIESDRVGFISVKGVGDYKQGISQPKKGIARCRDYVEVGTGKVDKSKENKHPAQYPEQLASWIIRLLSPEQGVVLDPFMGSGTTAVACIKENRKYLGIEVNPEYCQIANNRIIKNYILP